MYSMVVVGDRETIPPKIGKSPQNGEISMELGEIQGEFHQKNYREFIDNMFLIFYYVLGCLQAMGEVGGGEIIPPKMGKSPKDGDISVEWTEIQGDLD